MTSRSSFPSFGSQYPLDALNHKDALILLRHSATCRGDKSYIVPEDLQDKVISESLMQNMYAYLRYLATKYPMFMLADSLTLVSSYKIYYIYAC